MSVNMGDWWFDIATPEHFWIRRRFDVMNKLAGRGIRTARRAAEVGCGNGLLQRDIEDRLGIEVAGFDLNEVALNKNVSRRSALYCYDIHQRSDQFRNRFDLMLLFDVLEHIEDESTFLQSVKFHLCEGGYLLVNVPAHEFFRSQYDDAAGHVRRYSKTRLNKVLEDNGLCVKASTYWGLPLVPLLVIRKLIPLSEEDGSLGFDPGSRMVNSALKAWAKIEPLPQSLIGTSVMSVTQKQP
jgi:SAM-dependent methyltransferase